MHRPIFVLLITILLAAGMTSCNGSGSDTFDFQGSDAWLQQLYLGSVPIQAGKTTNVPLAHTSLIRIEGLKPVTPASLNDSLSFQISFRNMNSCNVRTLSDENLTANGQLVWVDGSNKILEYHMYHPMNYFISDQGYEDLGDPGDTFVVRIDFLAGDRVDGRQFVMQGDEFYIVWTASDMGIDDKDDDDLFGGSDPWLERLLIGNVVAENDKVINVPLAYTDKLRFEVQSPVTPQSLSQLFDFLIQIDNLDGNVSFTLTPAILAENGELVWVGTDNKVIEYRMNHAMNYILSGGQHLVLGDPGDTFKITVKSLRGAIQNGSQFNFAGDEFFVVWTESSSDVEK